MIVLRVKHWGLNDTSNLPQTPPYIYGVNTPCFATGSSSKNPKSTRTLTPPLDDEELARCRSTGLLEQKTPVALNAVGVLTGEMPHRCRSVDRSRVGFLSAHSPVECWQARRIGRSCRVPLAASAALPRRTDRTSLSVAARYSPPTDGSE